MKATKKTSKLLKAKTAYPYQKRAIRKLPGLLLIHRRVLAVGPTGCGKTFIAAQVMRKMIGKRVLWLAHRVELLEQAYDELVEAGIPKEMLRMHTGREKSGDDDALVMVASIEMFNGRHALAVPDVDLIVIDEAHRSVAATYRRVVDACPKALVLGLTATPWRLDGKGLGDIFANMYIIATYTELAYGGFISKPATYGIPREQARRILRGIRTVGGDYNLPQLGRAMMSRKLLGDVVSECARLAPGEPTIVFAVNRRHGQALLGRFLMAGRRAAYLDARTPVAERKAIFAKLKTGELDVVVNVDVLSEGVDFPSVKCIVLARPTRSLTRFLQHVGRGGRKHKGRRVIVLDHAGNCWRHGLPDAEHEWTLEDRPKDARGREAPVKQCAAFPSCTAMIPASCLTCPSCGAEQPHSVAETEEARIRLQLLRATVTERRRRERVIRKLAVENNWDASQLNTALKWVEAA